MTYTYTCGFTYMCMYMHAYRSVQDARSFLAANLLTTNAMAIALQVCTHACMHACMSVCL